jgi:cyanuric acid amidohydrolase
MRRAFVHRVPTNGPDDVIGLIDRIEAGVVEPAAIKAILGKTEGNGCVNDFSRGYAVQSLRTALSTWLEEAALDGIAMVMSGGTEGGLSPHLLIFEVRDVQEEDFPHQEMSLAMAVAHTAPMRPEMIGRCAQSHAVADAVQVAMKEASIFGKEDVHYVQVKCPLLTAARVAKAATRGQSVSTTDTLKSMAVSRGAAALGVAMALGEIDPGTVSDDSIANDMTIYSTRASCSAGVELMRNEILLIGNSLDWSGDLIISHDVMADAIDSGGGYS